MVRTKTTKDNGSNKTERLVENQYQVPSPIHPLNIIKIILDRPPLYPWQGSTKIKEGMIISLAKISTIFSLQPLNKTTEDKIINLQLEINLPLTLMNP